MKYRVEYTYAYKGFARQGYLIAREPMGLSQVTRYLNRHREPLEKISVDTVKNWKIQAR